MPYRKGGSKKNSVKFPDNLIGGNQILKNEVYLKGKF